MIQLLAIAAFVSGAGIAVYAIIATIAPRLDRIVAALSGQPLDFPVLPPRPPEPRQTPRSLAPSDSHSLTPALLRPVPGQPISRA